MGVNPLWTIYYTYFLVICVKRWLLLVLFSWLNQRPFGSSWYLWVLWTDRLIFWYLRWCRCHSSWGVVLIVVLDWRVSYFWLVERLFYLDFWQNRRFIYWWGSFWVLDNLYRDRDCRDRLNRIKVLPKLPKLYFEFMRRGLSLRVIDLIMINIIFNIR